MRRVARAAIAGMVTTLGAAGCGLSVQSSDLFLLVRVAQGKTLTMLVSDSGTIRCNGGGTKRLSDQLLLRARTLASDLSKDAKARLRIAAPRRSVAYYTIKLQDGTVSFPDVAAAKHHELAEAVLLAVQAQSAC